MKSRSSESGVILIMVLWVLVVLSVMAAQFAVGTHIESRITMNIKESAQAYYIARGGMLQVIDRLSRIHSWEAMMGKESENLPCPRWTWSTLSPPCDLPGGGSYRVMLEEEGNRIDLNGSSTGLLDILFESVDIEPESRRIILDSLADWRDKDDLIRPNGAEEDYYQGLKNPYHCKNGDLDSVEELLLVRGMDRSILYGGQRDGKQYPGIARFLTVFSISAQNNAALGGVKTVQMSRININSCSVQTFSVFPGVEPEMLEAIQKRRDQQGMLTPSDLAEIMGDDVYQRAAPWLASGFPTTIRITVLGLTPQGASGSAVSALVRFGGWGGGRPFDVLEWRDVVNSSQLIN
jgi:general secretion pathway protein K